MDLIHPHSKRDVVDALRTASGAETRVLTVGGRQHIDKGNPSEVDAELWTTLLDGRVAYDPAEMLCVVEAGMRIHDLRTILAEGGQEWPVDAPDDATVGGRGRHGRSDGPATPRRHDARHRRRDGGRDGRRASDQERGAHREERHRLRRAPVADRLARHPRGDRSGRPQGAPVAEGDADARERRRRRGARATGAGRRAASRRCGRGARPRRRPAGRVAGRGRRADGWSPGRSRPSTRSAIRSRRPASRRRRPWPRLPSCHRGCRSSSSGSNAIAR